MLDTLLLHNEKLYNTIIEILDQHKLIVSEYNTQFSQNQQNQFITKFIMPNTFGLHSFQYTYSYYMEEGLWGIEYFTVPKGYGVLIMGYYCNADFGGGGYLKTTLNGANRQEVPTYIVYNEKIINHLHIDPTNIVFAKEDDRFGCYVYNDQPFNINAYIYPLMFLIGHRTVLSSGSGYIEVQKIIQEEHKRQGYNDDAIQTVELFGNNFELRAKKDPDILDWKMKEFANKLNDELNYQCPFCGTLIDVREQEAKFCPYCGVSLEPPKKKKRKK